MAREFFTKARPVIITDAAEDWPCRQWTIEVLHWHWYLENIAVSNIDISKTLLSSIGSC